jgi:hypothetical protein
MRLWQPVLIALLGMGLALGEAARAEAQAALSLQTLQIELWPEFDQPATLVLLTGTLAPGTPTPAEVTVRIPAAAGRPHAAAYRDAADQLLSALYTTRREGDDLFVTVTVDALNFHLEYYDPGLTIAGEERTFQYRWMTDYPVAATTVRVQEPYGARDVQLEPAFTPAGVGDFGLSYQAREWGPLAAGDSVVFFLRYAKTSAGLSAGVVNPPTQAVSIDEGASGTGTVPGLPTAWLVGGLAVGALALAGGAGWVWWQRRPRPENASRGRRGKRRSVEANGSPAHSPPAPAAPRRFCTQCGQPVAGGDRFCRNCGAATTT